MQAYRLAFASPQADLPGALAWWAQYRDNVGDLEMTADPRLPFALKAEIVAFGAFAFGRSIGAVDRFARTAGKIARDGDDRFALLVNRGGAPTCRQTRRGAARR